MFAQERQQQIHRMVEEHGRVLVAELAERFDVSEQTIRKDLLALERIAPADPDARRRDCDGAGPTRAGVRRPPAHRGRCQAAHRRRRPQRFVQDGETIAFDASTTALEVARRLRQIGGWRELTVITNGIRIAEELAGQDGITILMPGGRMRWEALSVVGPWGDGFFRRINIARAFLGAAGFTIQSGLTDATEEEAQIKRAMVVRSDRGDRHRRPHQVGSGGARDVLPDRPHRPDRDRRARPCRTRRGGPSCRHRAGRGRPRADADATTASPTQFVAARP